MTSSWVREYTGVLLVIFLFDIGWGLGLLATHPLHAGSLRFCGQIVFVVANGGIGLVLLIFFCIMSENVRKTCSFVVILKLLRYSSDWEQQSRLYTSSKQKDQDNKIKILDTKDVSHAQTFEVHGNPAVVTSEEKCVFESETQFN